jgi:acetyl-CoA synthetase
VPSVQHVVVLRHLGDPAHADAAGPRPRLGRAHRQPADAGHRRDAADDPAILLYTSGTTGKPKGCVWTHVSFLGSMVTRDMHLCADFKASDRYFFMSDIGWMVGAMCACIPSYFGGSLLVAEGVPDFPDAGRLWRLVADHKVTYLGVSPTLVRSMMRTATAEVEPPRPVPLRITTSGGEAWTEAPWRWFFEHVCKLAPAHHQHRRRHRGRRLQLHRHRDPPAAARQLRRPGPGVGTDIVDDAGRPVRRGQVGELVLRPRTSA